MNLLVQVVHDVLQLTNTSCGVGDVQDVSGYLVLDLSYWTFLPNEQNTVEPVLSGTVLSGQNYVPKLL